MNDQTISNNRQEGQGVSPPGPPTGEPPGALFRQGDLHGAIEVAGQAVRLAPSDVARRLLLAELLVFDGNLARADTVLNAAAAVDPGLAVVVAEFRQLVLAAGIRKQVLGEGRAPEFLGGATESQQHLLRALLALREGDQAGAALAAKAAEAARPASPGRLLIGSEWREFADFRDACDLWGGTMEVLTTTGRYFWIPLENIISLQFQPAVRPRDLAWRRCTMDVRNGPEGDVYVPALYHAPEATDVALRLGRATEWTNEAPVRGRGQRLFLAGEDGSPIQSLTEISFT
jgi:type VI secretion system protein ImpE